MSIKESILAKNSLNRKLNNLKQSKKTYFCYKTEKTKSYI